MPTSLTTDQLLAYRTTLQTMLMTGVMESRTADGRDVKFRSVDDIMKTLTLVDAWLSPGANRTAFAQHRRGDGPRGPGFPFFDDFDTVEGSDE